MGYDSKLRKQLAFIQERDQRHRMEMMEKSNNNMPPSGFMEIYTKQNELDKENVILIEKILDEYGYPSQKLVGSQLNTTVFIVIQHSGHETLEKYLPLFKDATEKGDMQKSNLALVIDRVKMGNGEKQIYGSQLKSNMNGSMELYPIEDKENVNKRRAEMGLQPLEEYLKMYEDMGIEVIIPSN